MTADFLLATLLRAQAAASLAIVLVLLLRGPARLVIGAELTYRLWAVAPIAAIVSLFPSLSDFGRAGFYIGEDFPAIPPPHVPLASILLDAWALGIAATAALMVLGEVLFRRAARAGRAGPAVMGLSWPRIVTPADFLERFTAQERDLIGRHERTHIKRRDPRSNLVIAASRALGWFNPLVHVAAGCARLDQELACDAAVVEAWPACRRDYGATLLKAHMTSPGSPLSCAWFAPGRHPLEVRVAMLSKKPLSISSYLRGAAAVGLTAFIVAAAVWSFAPAGSAAPAYHWKTVQIAGPHGEH